jgi:uncharacterized membrane protein YeaQ/YmgE (transglycosylase-associated protein family)
MSMLESIQPYTPLIVMAINGVLAGWIVGSPFEGSSLVRNLIMGLVGAFLVAPWFGTISSNCQTV